MKIYYILIFAFLIRGTGVLGQTENKEFAQAEELLANDRPAAALPLYLNLLKNDSADGNLNLKIGICYLKSRSQKSKAAFFLNKAISATSNKKEIDKPEVTINFKIKTSDKNAVSEYSSVFSQQSSLFFIGQKPGNKKEEQSEVLFENNFSPIIARKAGTLLSHQDSVKSGLIDISFIKSSFDTVIAKEATVMTSEDNQVIITYKDDKGDGNLYISILNGNKWTRPEKLDKMINTGGWESNECISADGNWLYFTSDHEGGYGGMDIYKSKKLPNGEWSKASNLGPIINGPYDEQAPFTLYDESTLYFSSNRNKKDDNFDVFTSSVSANGTWLEPVNVGYPTDKINDESSYPLTSDTSKSDSSTPKQARYTEKDNCMFTFINKKEIAFSVIKGEIKDPSVEVPKSVKISITDNETGEIISFYNSSSETGQYLFILPPGRNNNITYEAAGYLFQSENINMSAQVNYYETRKAIQLLPITVGSKVVLNNVFYNPGQSTILPASDVELNRVFNLLTLYPLLTVEISDYMTTKENAKINKIISQQRAQAVVDYLFKKGISRERISAKGYIKYKSNIPKKKSDPSVLTVNTQMDQWVELNIIEKKPK